MVLMPLLRQQGQWLTSWNCTWKLKVHPIFHVSQLKKAVAVDVPFQQLSKFLSDDQELLVTPKKVLAIRKLLNGSNEILIKWNNLPDHENTWEEFVPVVLIFFSVFTLCCKLIGRYQSQIVMSDFHFSIFLFQDHFTVPYVLCYVCLDCAYGNICLKFLQNQLEALYMVSIFVLM